MTVYWKQKAIIVLITLAVVCESSENVAAAWAAANWALVNVISRIVILWFRGCPSHTASGQTKSCLAFGEGNATNKFIIYSLTDGLVAMSFSCGILERGWRQNTLFGTPRVWVKVTRSGENSQKNTRKSLKIPEKYPKRSDHRYF